jgi:hypothetical protein
MLADVRDRLIPKTAGHARIVLSDAIALFSDFGPGDHDCGKPKRGEVEPCTEEAHARWQRHWHPAAPDPKESPHG